MCDMLNLDYFKGHVFYVEVYNTLVFHILDIFCVNFIFVFFFSLEHAKLDNCNSLIVGSPNFLWNLCLYTLIYLLRVTGTEWRRTE